MKIERQLLLQALELVEPGVAKKELVEQSGSFVFKDGQLVTYNEFLACRLPSPLGKEIAGAVAAGDFLKVLRKLPDEELDVTSTAEHLVLKGKNRRTRFRYERDLRLPIEAVEDPGAWHALPEHFTEILGTVGRCAGSDQTQFMLTCVHLAPDFVEAFDNYQFCRWHVKTGLKKSVFVTYDTLKHLRQRGAKAWSLTGAWLHFKSAAGLLLSCRRYDARFPDMTPLLEKGGKPLSLPKGLNEGALIAEILASEPLNPDGSRGEKLLEVQVLPGKLRIRGLGRNGDHVEQRALDYAGPPLEFLMLPKILCDMVKYHPDCQLMKDRLHVQTQDYVYASRLGRKTNGQADEDA